MDEQTWEQKLSPCREFLASPMVRMLSAICGALLRQQLIAALNAFTITNYDLHPGPSKATHMLRRKGATGRIPSCN